MSETAPNDNLQEEWPISGIAEGALVKPNSGWKPNPPGLKLLRYANDLYESGSKLWTKEMFLSIEREMSKDLLPTHVPIRKMNGEFYPFEVPEGIGSVDDQNRPKCAQLIFIKYQDVLTDTYNFYADRDPGYYRESTLQWDHNDSVGFRTIGLHIGWNYGKPTSSSEYSHLKAVWDEARQNWTRSSACSELIAILKNKINIPKAISRLVCFGLGDLERGSDIMASPVPIWSRRTITQHVAALTMAATFGELLGTGPLPIHVQDPAYTPLTQNLLRDLGFDVVGGLGSLAFTLVDDDAVVFTCAPDIPVKQIVADIAKPAAMIWNLIRPNEEGKKWTLEVEDGEEMFVSPWLTDEDSPRTRKLVEDYDMFEFPDEPELFGNLGIYIRRD